MQNFSKKKREAILLKKKDTGFAVFSPFKSGRTKKAGMRKLWSVRFYFPLNQVGLKKFHGQSPDFTRFIIPLNQVGLKIAPIVFHGVFRFIIPLNQVGLKIGGSITKFKGCFIIPLNQVGLKIGRFLQWLR